MLQITFEPVAQKDLPEVLALHARAFGPGRFARTAYRIREGTPLISRFCLQTKVGGDTVAALRFTEVTIGGKPGALLLGPLAVEARYAGLGYGKGLVEKGLQQAKAAGIRIVVLVGDEAYYSRFGSKHVPPGQFILPGPVDPARVLAIELAEGSMAEYKGLVEPAANDAMK